MDDREVETRLAFYTTAAFVLPFRDADHHTMGTDHAWDIARRLRAFQNEAHQFKSKLYAKGQGRLHTKYSSTRRRAMKR